MIRDWAKGHVVTITDEFGDSLVVDPRDVMHSSRGYFVELEIPSSDKSIWLNKEAVIELRTALAHALNNFEEQEQRERNQDRTGL